MRDEWPTVVAGAKRLRHDLHQRPELAWAEVDTAHTVRAALDDMGIEYRPCAGTGTVAQLAAGADGRHIALRADLDAMPIAEDADHAYRSQQPGVMHACGHDGHTATLLAVARWLKLHEADLPGPVTLLFQPAEEGGHGAREMIADGCLAGAPDVRPVEAVFGWHNWPGLPLGQAICPNGPVMSANGTFQIGVRGQGGHASQPEATRDPVLAAAAITVALQQIVARRLSPQSSAVVAVTSLRAEAAATVTPDDAELAGSVRVANDHVRDHVFDLIAEISTAVAAAHGVDAAVETTARYGATVNHPEPAAELRGRLAAEFGDGWSRHDSVAPVMASEDFSYYLQRIPGAFALIGGSPEDAGVPLHSARYDFDDRLIDPVARILIGLAGVAEPARIA
ncbi:N(2)-acetyl-L-2,4-diaminobutanoate deacetylase DoeB2 [Jongsikchunia kroppenstedtii]|uniref:N(2)-acetyl-L-2,4-diaminobutanoate deacetylase DoeB2 n=1 Tax=Jongsikchunia kroppenstedtii TaxID=1121721 RepID=UPI0003628F85|nr:N(2)-acetyl-L-2,4-diaminobutanoate deacetylase DoeB2 [Jongsikchunia kroppenstedtii]